MQQISNNAHIHNNKPKDLDVGLDTSNDMMHHLEFCISASNQGAHLAVIHHRSHLDKEVFRNTEEGKTSLFVRPNLSVAHIDYIKKHL